MFAAGWRSNLFGSSESTLEPIHDARSNTRLVISPTPFGRLCLGDRALHHTNQFLFDRFVCSGVFFTGRRKQMELIRISASNSMPQAIRQLSTRSVRPPPAIRL